MKKERISEIFKQEGFNITDKQVQQFEDYYNFLVEENEKYNLTAITDFEDVVYKHFIDCGVGINFFEGKVLDVGSGAGFPGIVLAILNDKLQITLVDSLNKRVNFLNQLIEKLQLKNVKAIHARAEEFKEKESFDRVTARAVANLSTLSEYLLPFVKMNGKAIIYKGADFFEEVESAQNAISELGCQIEEIKRYRYLDNTRSIIVLRKIKQTPSKYPRSGNQPRKNPL